MSAPHQLVESEMRRDRELWEAMVNLRHALSLSNDPLERRQIQSALEIVERIKQ